ncbi:unnamed protein product [Caenorhabditis auriculariae]|uniref:Uncharacterized protein n=1 Tax=Caenorhabditis auriculariae TaxID=2777116 RepID=A0A8S1HPU1_9PELO|nr:unnamed protein product [Caenorhabditis auriculariae]
MVEDDMRKVADGWPESTANREPQSALKCRESKLQREAALRRLRTRRGHSHAHILDSFARVLDVFNTS